MTRQRNSLAENLIEELNNLAHPESLPFAREKDHYEEFDASYLIRYRPPQTHCILVGKNSTQSVELNHDDVKAIYRAGAKKPPVSVHVVRHSTEWIHHMLVPAMVFQKELAHSSILMSASATKWYVRTHRDVEESLDDHQIRMARLGGDRVAANGVLLCMPVGTGKTRVSARMALQMKDRLVLGKRWRPLPSSARVPPNNRTSELQSVVDGIQQKRRSRNGVVCLDDPITRASADDYVTVDGQKYVVDARVHVVVIGSAGLGTTLRESEISPQMKRDFEFEFKSIMDDDWFVIHYCTKQGMMRFVKNALHSAAPFGLRWRKFTHKPSSARTELKELKALSEALMKKAQSTEIVLEPSEWESVRGSVELTTEDYVTIGGMFFQPVATNTPVKTCSVMVELYENQCDGHFDVDVLVMDEIHTVSQVTTSWCPYVAGARWRWRRVTKAGAHDTVAPPQVADALFVASRRSNVLLPSLVNDTSTTFALPETMDLTQAPFTCGNLYIPDENLVAEPQHVKKQLRAAVDMIKKLPSKCLIVGMTATPCKNNTTDMNTEVSLVGRKWQTAEDAQRDPTVRVNVDLRRMRETPREVHHRHTVTLHEWQMERIRALKIHPEIEPDHEVLLRYANDLTKHKLLCSTIKHLYPGSMKACLSDFEHLRKNPHGALPPNLQDTFLSYIENTLSNFFNKTARRIAMSGLSSKSDATIPSQQDGRFDSYIFVGRVWQEVAADSVSGSAIETLKAAPSRRLLRGDPAFTMKELKERPHLPIKLYQCAGAVGSKIYRPVDTRPAKFAKVAELLAWRDDARSLSPFPAIVFLNKEVETGVKFLNQFLKHHLRKGVVIEYVVGETSESERLNIRQRYEREEIDVLIYGEVFQESVTLKTGVTPTASACRPWVAPTGIKYARYNPGEKRPPRDVINMKDDTRAMKNAAANNWSTDETKDIVILTKQRYASKADDTVRAFGCTPTRTAIIMAPDWNTIGVKQAVGRIGRLRTHAPEFVRDEIRMPIINVHHLIGSRATFRLDDPRSDEYLETCSNAKDASISKVLATLAMNQR